MTNNKRQARFELVLLGIIALVIVILELYVDVFERLVTWAAMNESLLITEIVTLAVVLSIGLSIYAWRRWREAVSLEIDKAQLQQTVTDEQDANRLMRSYADAVTRGQEAERHRLARELHDDTIQRLIVINQTAALAAFDHADSPAASDLQEIQLLLDETIDHVRHFITELRPTYLDELGLVTALRTLIKETRDRTELLIEFEAKGESCRLRESIELALYRIVQSALSNVVSHAEASTAEVVLDFRPNAVYLDITDDGNGFLPVDETALVASGHFGLIGMRERAELIGATYQIDAQPGRGTKIAVCVPLDSTSG